jgi:flavodoxin I
VFYKYQFFLNGNKNSDNVIFINNFFDLFFITANKMKILLVFDSKFGNTKKIAMAMGEVLNNINNVKVVQADEALDIDLKEYDMLIVGSPTNGGWPSPSAKIFLNSIQADALKGKKAAAFDTGSTSDGEGFIVKAAIKVFGYASSRIAKMLTKKGAEVIASETFYVKGMEGPIMKGEITRAQKWALDLLQK